MYLMCEHVLLLSCERLHEYLSGFFLAEIPLGPSKSLYAIRWVSGTVWVLLCPAGTALLKCASSSLTGAHRELDASKTCQDFDFWLLCQSGTKGIWLLHQARLPLRCWVQGEWAAPRRARPAAVVVSTVAGSSTRASAAASLC